MIQVTPLTCPHPVELPPLIRVRQHLPEPREVDIRAAVERELAGMPAVARIEAGQRIAITAGSRGIARIAEVIAAAVAALRARGADPFVIPAMGSHGGATPEGQKSVLAEMGVTEEYVRAPILATMDTVELGRLADGTPVLMDRHAAAADGILLVNRVKPHTDFSGPIESGLAKMCAIGLGKRIGAEAMHSAGPAGLRMRIPLAARISIATRPILGGLAILENPHEDVAMIVGLPPEDIGAAGEERLLDQARILRPTLPFPMIDLLIVDTMGKDISGTGMDTGVIGRMFIPGVPEPARPRINCIVVLSLTPVSHGNSVGLGLADIVTARMAGSIDWQATWTNAMTAGILGPGRGRLPIVAATDFDAVQLGRLMCGTPPGAPVRVARIASTKHLAEMRVSAALLETADTALEQLGESEELRFE